MIEQLAVGETAIRVWRLRGDGSGPPAHLQAGVHADEIPGMYVLHRLLPRLLADAAAGRLRGDVTVVPQANPLGIRQFDHGRLLGRFDRATGHNFNRGFPDAAARAGTAEVFAWQAALLQLAAGSNIVLDLHTDDEALPYLYVHAAMWPAAKDLAAALGSAVAVVWDGGGGGAFEDAVVQSWLAAGRAAECLCSTIELRGQADVDPAHAAADADGLHRLLCRRGVIDGAGELPAWRGEAVPIGHVQTLRAPASGILVFSRAPGDVLAAGERFATLIPVPGEPGTEVVLAAPNTGRLFTRPRDRLVSAGTVVAKLTGDRPSPSWADVPLDD